MRLILLATAMVATSASIATAQYPTNFGPRQTAMGALGQTGVLNNRSAGRESSNGADYRVAARNGIGSSPQLNKPFAGVQKAPTISPYLNMFREESPNAAPNYHTFVRPQLEQYEQANRQQAQLQQLQRQVRQATYHQTPARSIAGGARYGDTGRYYGGWRRQ